VSARRFADVLITPQQPAYQAALEAFVNGLSTKQKGRDALSKLRAVATEDHATWQQHRHPRFLTDLVLRACFDASRFDPQDDPNEVRRKLDSAFNGEVLNQVKAMRSLVDWIRKYQHQYSFLIESALAKGGYDLVLTDIEVRTFPPTCQPALVPIATGGKPMVEQLHQSMPNIGKVKSDRQGEDLTQAFTNVLDALATIVETERSPTKGKGPWMHGTQYGCLEFGDCRLDTEKRTERPDVVTMLLFNLVFLFRRFSLGNGEGSVGELMPTGGKPRWALATALANLALGTAIQPSQATDRIRTLLKRNPRIGLVAWPRPDV